MLIGQSSSREFVVLHAGFDECAQHEMWAPTSSAAMMRGEMIHTAPVIEDTGCRCLGK
jgi:hypothetical protein